MANEFHKSDLNNIRETWDENERKENGNGHDHNGRIANAATGNEDLDKVIREEAVAYDLDDKSRRLLGGDRASVNDDNTER